MHSYAHVSRAPRIAGKDDVQWHNHLHAEVAEMIFFWHSVWFVGVILLNSGVRTNRMPDAESIHKKLQMHIWIRRPVRLPTGILLLFLLFVLFALLL